MIDPGQAERLGRLFDGPSLPVALAAHVRALEVGLDQAAAEYGAEPAVLRAAFVRWGFDLAPLERRPRLPRTSPVPAGPAADGDNPAALQVPPRTTPAKVERAFLEREVARGERLSARALARELGVDRSDPTRILQRLRALREADPSLAVLRTWFAAIQRMTAAELAEAREEARGKHADAIEVGDWWQAGACPVRSECLRAELAAPVGYQPAGVVGGKAPWERTAIRVATGTAGNQTTGRFLGDQVLTERAHQRAGQVGITRAAAELDTSLDTLERAFDRWRLGPVPPLPPRPARFATAQQAGEAYTLVLRVGITAAARKLGTSDATLRQAFNRHGLPWPPPQRPGVRPVDPVFFALNPAVVVPARLEAEAAAARVRRQEAFEALGARVTYALGDENTVRPPLRVWRVARRARLAREAALAARLGSVSVSFPFPVRSPVPADQTGNKTPQA